MPRQAAYILVAHAHMHVLYYNYMSLRYPPWSSNDNLCSS